MPASRAIEAKSIYVVGIGSVSPIGPSSRKARRAFASGVSGIRPFRVGQRDYLLGHATEEAEVELELLRRSTPGASHLDRSVQLAMLASREALRQARFAERHLPFATILGSSRGATATLEDYHAQFLRSGVTPTRTSPTTTLGNLASNVARDALHCDLSAEVSSACSTSHQAMLFGAAWLRAGFGRACLVGGAEAPLTAFTLAQFEALGLFGDGLGRGESVPYQPFAREPKNRLVLGEGACIIALELMTQRQAAEAGALAELAALGTGQERAASPTGISPEGLGLEIAMRRALARFGAGVDAVVPHAPGTKKGDEAELAALERVFCERLPALCSSKWQMGHTFGAAGAFGVELALALLGGTRPAPTPYASILAPAERPPSSVMVNATGFGGGCCSVILRRVNDSD